MNALLFLVKTLVDLYILTFAIRLLLQAVRADFYNPFSQAIVRITNPLVLPLRRIVPSVRGLDMATLLVILVLELAATAGILLLAGFAVPAAPILVYYAGKRFLTAFVRLYFIAVIVRVILSWVGPGTRNPVSDVVNAITEPLLRPVRRVIPPLGGLDISALLVIIGLQAILLLIQLPRVLG